MQDAKKKFIKLIQKENENHITNTIIIPLLDKLNYKRTEFYGGIDEQGKDILLWNEDNFGDLKLSVAQVKHFKLTNKASDEKSLQTVVNQLQNCYHRNIIHPNKNSYFPSNVILISTHPISSKTMQTRFSSHSVMTDKQITLIDGEKLVDLVFQHCPEIIREYIGLEIDIKNRLGDYLNNDILLQALHFNNTKNLKVIHTDIDFSLGQESTELFFKRKLEPTTATITIGDTDYKRFLQICDKTKSIYESNYAEHDEASIKKMFEQSKLDYDFLLKKRNAVEAELKGIADTPVGEKQFMDRRKELFEKKLNLDNQLKLYTKPLAKVTIDGTKLASQIISHRKWIENNIQQFNKKRPTSTELKNYLQKCKEIIDASNYFYNNTNSLFFSCLGYEIKSTLRSDYQSTRLKLPIQNVFDTGLNIIVFGEAGAGKSTSIQIHALNESQNNDTLVICVPLANVLQNWAKTDPQLSEVQKTELLEDAISKYLIFKGVKISTEHFISEYLKKRKVALLLDGIDEALKLNQWLPGGIDTLAKKYSPELQIIVTCRSTGQYLKEIPFLSVTLLPFTDHQRNEFIDKWFGAENRKYAVMIKKHLQVHKAISEIVCNPLLVTTLCVLAQNNIELPFTETMLYDSRLNLLAGYYDRTKGITQRLENSPDTLQKISQKIAFQLHKEGKRAKSLEELKMLAVSFTMGKMGKEKAEKVINELINPCNILVPMTDEGEFGFGHLKYQEHLAAKEIDQHRGIRVAELINQPWWKDTFILYAKIADHLDWLIHEIGPKATVRKSVGIILEMIGQRPLTEQHALRSYLEGYIKFNE